MASRKEELISKYNLLPLDEEGGYFSFIGTYGENSGSILYLITEESFSSLHVLTDDELWFFLEGDPCIQLVVENEKSEERVLSENSRYSLVKRGSAQGTKLQDGGSYALFSTVMSPRYRDDMYSVPDSDFIKRHPECREFLKG